MKPPTMQQGHSDDFQTPEWVLDYLMPYIPKKWTIWECACGKGNLVRGLQTREYRVIFSDILNGAIFDFLAQLPPISFDMILTNPPYTSKDRFLAQCYEFNKPFALLMPLTALEGQKRQALYREHGLELILLPRRVNFETPSGEGAGAWFASAWFTSGLQIGHGLTFST